MRNRCVISLGSNLGDRGQALSAAAVAIERLASVSDVRRSRVYQTPAIGGPSNQPPFLNACVAAETSLSADELIGKLQTIEAELGRERINRWAARKLDLDLILYGRLIGSSATATVPHPRYTVRRFVVLPAAEVAGDLRDPRFGWSLRELADQLRMPPSDLVAKTTPSDLVASTNASDGVAGTRSQNAEWTLAITDARPEWTERLWTEVLQRSPAEHERSPQTVRLAADVSLHKSWKDFQGAPSLWVRAFHPHRVAPVQPDEPLHPLPSGIDRPTTPPAQPMWQGDDSLAESDRSRWPTASQLFSGGRRQPEYWIEMGDPRWAAEELFAAAASLTCPCQPQADGWGPPNQRN